jgi:acetyltransferase-like isoleucine patch superfamily enzyme
MNPKAGPFDHTRMESTSGYFATLFQLIPLCIVYPIWQLGRFFLFFRSLLLMLHKVPNVHSLTIFVATLVIFHFLWITLSPLVFVVAKWLIVGKYRQGRYPLWGEYYLRWWFVDILRKISGRGIWGCSEVTLNIYYRLLGANIGADARISLEAEIAEFDLVEIGEGAAVEYATVRPFGVDNGCMILGPVTIGQYASVGARAVVGPFAFVPEFAHLGPGSSSYDINTALVQPGSDVKHAQYNRQCLPEPSKIWVSFVAWPITFFVDTMSHIPAFSVLYWMVSMPWRQGKAFESINDLMRWLCDPRRIPFYIGIRIARAIAAPLIYMFFAILVKRLIIGPFKPGSRDTTSQWQLTRHYLVARLFSRENMQDCTEVLGRHYELVSCLYRALGAKVGKRVFWPGHQPIFSGEFDLLEIGDDVVFGSRSAIFCTTVDSCEKVILCSGSNVSDNTIVLPGSILGKNAVLGSNTVCPTNRYLPESSVWFGLRGGEPVMLERGVEDTYGPVLATDVKTEKIQLQGDKTTLRPFGKAFYYGEASYSVWPLSFIIFATFVSKIFIAAVHTLPVVGALHLTALYFYGGRVRERVYNRYDLEFSEVYFVMQSFYFLTHLARVLLWIVIEIWAKWAFMGRRQEGRYNYDQSSYGQWWELYQIVTRVRSLGRINFMNFLAGTPYMATFFRALGAKIGADCCLYPAGASPFMPEPDLVDIGDRCVIDSSSVVCHLNTRGNFELAKIVLENNVTLRTQSRIQQGVYMEAGSMLLEKSLVMTGEVIEADSVWQGAPAQRIYSYDASSISTRGGGAADSPIGNNPIPAASVV